MDANKKIGAAVLLVGFGVVSPLQRASAQPGWVLSHQKISDTQGGFTGTLDDLDIFGGSVASLGDLDGDGVGDLAVGAAGDDDGGPDRGAVWVLFLNADGSVKSHQKISDTQGGFTGVLDHLDLFGASVASLGDLDGDGVGDLAVGASGDDDGGDLTGAVWILFLNSNGTVKSHQKISATQGGFTGILNVGDFFGGSVASLGDLDGDGVGDLTVGAGFDDDGGQDRGAVWVLFLNADGSVKSHQKISDTQGGFTGVLDDLNLFGASVASLGDLDGDAVGDLAVGAYFDDDGGALRGAVWILFLSPDGTVKSNQKISNTEGGFTGTLDDSDWFGRSVASLGDLDGDGVGDLGVGAILDDDGGDGHGAVWLLFLNTDGTVKSHQKISDTQGGFTGILDDLDFFGFSVASLGDLDGDGVSDLAVGVFSDDDGGSARGAVYVLFLDGNASINIESSDPPHGAIDARQPSDPNGENAAGWNAITLTFDGDASEATADDFSVATDPPGGAVEIADVSADGSEVIVTFDAIIPVAAWTIVTHIASGSSVRIGSLPADTNGDKISNANDVLHIFDVLNSGGPHPRLYHTDVDRSGATNVNDVLRVIDLLNGAGVYDVFNGASLPD